MGQSRNRRRTVVEAHRADTQTSDAASLVAVRNTRMNAKNNSPSRQLRSQANKLDFASFMGPENSHSRKDNYVEDSRIASQIVQSST